MRIKKFKIENFRNLQLVECIDVPNLMIITGPNGCGKSALLEAIDIAKNAISSYSGGKLHANLQSHLVSSGKEKANISLTIEFTENEIAYCEDISIDTLIPKEYEIKVEITDRNNISFYSSEGFDTNITNCVKKLFNTFDIDIDNIGYFELIQSNRIISSDKMKLWNPAELNPQKIKVSIERNENKFEIIKNFILNTKKIDERTGDDKLSLLTYDFERLLKGYNLDNVFEDKTPFEFIFSTPSGNIDIDELSSGEKETIINLIRFSYINKKNSIILFDEIDAHLHPELARNYFNILKDKLKGNQLIFTTHSPEIINESISSLYTIIPNPNKEINQLIKISDDTEIQSALVKLLGSKGIVSFNQHIIFIEGNESSNDIKIYEKIFPSDNWPLTFIPAGDKNTTMSIIDKINTLLSSNIYQKFYSIVDRDFKRNPENINDRIYYLKRYHIENYLLNEELILGALKILLEENCPFDSPDEIINKLKELLESDIHINAYSKVLYNQKRIEKFREASKKYDRENSYLMEPISFEDVKHEAENKIKKYITDNIWIKECIGRDMLKALSQEIPCDYVRLKNEIINRMDEPPEDLLNIIKKILD